MRGRAADLPLLDLNHRYIGRFGRYDFYVGSVGIAGNPIPQNTLFCSVESSGFLLVWTKTCASNRYAVTVASRKTVICPPSVTVPRAHEASI